MRRAPLVILALYAAFLAWVAIAASWDTLHRFWTSDDGFFYLTIARNIARGHGSTFDGLSVTNGYQPLWLALIAVLFRATGPLTPEVGARVVMTLSIVCVAGGVAMIARLIDRLAAPAIVISAASLALLAAVGFSFFGLEAHLSVVMTGVVFGLTWHRWRNAVVQRRVRGRDTAFGLALGLLALTRLDLAVWIVILPPALAMARQISGWSWRAVSRTVAVEWLCASSVVGSYLIVNRVMFGLWLPISAVLRTRSLGLRWDPLSPTAWLDYLAAAVMIGLPLVMLIAAVNALKSRGLRAVLATRLGFSTVLAAGVLAHTLVVMLFAAAVEWRYLVTSSCALAVIGAALITELLAMSPPPRAAWIRGAVGVGAVVLALMLTALSVRRAMQPSESFERSDLTHFSQSLSSLVTRDAVVFAVDLSGEPGWFCDCHLINGDGVVNDWSFQTFVRRHRLSDYLDAKGVNYVIVKAASTVGDTVALNGWDWRSLDAHEFPVASFPRASAVHSTGRFYLFTWRR